MATIARTRSRSRISRGAFAAIGCLFVALGTIGIFVPGWPTTIFGILALGCFKKSNARLENWLLGNRWLGPTLRDWEESRSLTMRAKVLAISAIWISIGLSCLLISKVWVAAMLLLIAACLTWYLSTRPTKAPTVIVQPAGQTGSI